MAHIVVVGTGGAGLSTAIFAAKNGCKVSLIEKQERIGGMLHVANGEFSGAEVEAAALRAIPTIEMKGLLA